LLAPEARSRGPTDASDDSSVADATGPSYAATVG